MKPNIIPFALLPVAALVFTSCANLGGNEQTTVIDAPNGAAVVDTYTNSATVTAVNTSSRKLSLTMANGTLASVKCGSGVTNFNQIKVGDRINVTMIDELAIYLGKGKAPSTTAEGLVALAPKGAKPGAVMATTVKITARITSVNAAKRLVTLKLSDGSSKTLKVGKDVNLSLVKAGEDVTVQHTEATAITVTKA